VPSAQSSRENLRYAAALVADQPAGRAVELDLGACVGAIAELVLQPLHGHCVDPLACPVGQPARHEETAQALGRLCQHEERVAHRRREEPLVPGDPVAASPEVFARGLGPRRICAHVGATLLFGHAHAERDRTLVHEWHEALVIGRRGELRPPGRVDRSVVAQRRRHCVGHRYRAKDRRLELGEEHERRCALDVAAWRLAPRRAVQTVLQREPHQRVVTGMELDLIDTPSEAVVRAQRRRVRIGQPGVHLHLGRAGVAAELLETRAVVARMVEA
jgi:hypothetical protein